MITKGDRQPPGFEAPAPTTIDPSLTTRCTLRDRGGLAEARSPTRRYRVLHRRYPMNVKIADRIRAVATLATLVVLIYALWVSRGHIEHVGYLLGLTTFEARTMFVIIDIPVIIGKLLSGPWFAPTTRREGRRMMIAFIAASLGMNVASGIFGAGYGAAAYGALIVIVALWMERVLSRIKPAASVTRAKTAQVETTTPRQRAARSAAATRARRAAAPTSPGMPPVADSLQV